MSDIANSYCTLAEFKKFINPPGQTLSIDGDDDDVIESLIETASRRLDDLCGRKFYPSVLAQLFDIPDDDVLWFDDDLLAVITFLNGDATSILSTEYILKPANHYPKYCLQMRDITSIYFLTNTNASSQQVLSLTAFFGYHEQYATRAWKAAGTLAAAWASTTTLTATMTAGHTLDAHGGQILKIDNELYNSSSVVANTLTVQARGDNGSTAATHLILAPVYIWSPMKDISTLNLEIARVMYRSRYGENVDVTSTYTNAGVIVTPRSLPVWAQEILGKYQRRV
jgi:hypothetical protein